MYKKKPGKPATIKFHSKTFNYVDRLDIMLSFLKYPHSTTSEFMVILVYIQRMFIVQAHSCCEDSRWDYEGFDPAKYKTDKQYRRNLYKE